MIRRIAFIAMFCMLFAQPARATTPPEWRVDAAKSSLSFEVKVSGQLVTGQFPGFGSLIMFDPSNLAGSSARITVDATGIRTQNATRDAMLLKPAWFNVLDFPQATFQSTGFSSLGRDKYLCKGRLKIKGISKDIDLPFNLAIDGSAATMTGQTDVRRLDFRIGEGPDFAEDTPVALSVKVLVKIKAYRVK